VRNGGEECFLVCALSISPLAVYVRGEESRRYRSTFLEGLSTYFLLSTPPVAPFKKVPSAFLSNFFRPPIPLLFGRVPPRLSKEGRQHPYPNQPPGNLAFFLLLLFPLLTPGRPQNIKGVPEEDPDNF